MGILIFFLIGCLVLLVSHLLYCFFNDRQIVPDSILERLPKQYFVTLVTPIKYRDYSGKPLLKDSTYRIGRKRLWYVDYVNFGYLWGDRDSIVNKKSDCTWDCYWDNKGTVFSLKEDAEIVLQDIINNPERYRFCYEYR